MERQLGALILFALVTLTFSQEWDDSIKISNGKIFWKIDSDFITFRMEAKTDGWIGLGFNPEDNKMQNCDMVILSGKKLKVEDFFSYDMEKPTRDEIQNLENVNFGREDGVTWMIFKRKFISDDKNMDLDLKRGKLKLVWAYGNENRLEYHNNNRGLREVDLPEESVEVSPVSDWDSSATFPSGKIYWKTSEKDIIFRVESFFKNIGWLGIGFNPEDQKMKNCDMIIISGSPRNLKIQDYFSTGFEIPSLDDEQNLVIIKKGIEDGLLFMEFSRKLNSGDFQDTIISSGITDVVWAYGDSDHIKYHKENRGLMRLELVGEVEDSSVEISIESSWHGSQSFSGGSFSWLASWDSLTVQISCDTSGWLGIGFSPDDGKMMNADIVILQGTAEDDLSVLDCFSSGTVKPKVDQSQDIVVKDMKKNGGKMEMIFERKLKTGDGKEDKEILVGEEVTVIWAYGSELGDISYHGQNRGAVNVLLVDEDKITNPEDAFYSKGEDGYYYRDGAAYVRVHSLYYPVNEDGYGQVGELYYKAGEVFMMVDGSYLEATEDGFYFKDNYYWKNNLPYAHENNLYFEINPDGFYSFMGYSWKDGIRYLRVDGSYCKTNEDGYCLIDNSFYWNGKNNFGKKNNEYLMENEDGFYFYDGFWWKNDLRYIMKDGRYFRT